MADITITAAEVQDKLYKTWEQTIKAPGADLIHPRLLKELVVQVAYPLAIIFQQSIDQKRVPQQWRTAITSSLSSRKGANAIPPTTDQSVWRHKYWQATWADNPGSHYETSRQQTADQAQPAWFSTRKVLSVKPAGIPWTSNGWHRQGKQHWHSLPRLRKGIR